VPIIEVRSVVKKCGEIMSVDGLDSAVFFPLSLHWMRRRLLGYLPYVLLLLETRLR